LHYWVSSHRFQGYLGFLTAQYAFDAQAFVSIRKNESQTELVDNSIPTLFIFGEKDPVSSIKHTKKLARKFFFQPKFMKVNKAAHYPHIEMPDKVVKRIKFFTFRH
jgi:pimeloyl-ACP methyl ester carboxylesterase